jgi:hypothetical protein
MTTKVNYLLNKNVVTVAFNGEQHSFHSDDPVYEEVKLAIKDGMLDNIPEIVSTATKIESYSDENFKVRDGIIYVDNLPVPSELSSRILEFREEDLPYMPLVNFARKLIKNPSYRSVNQLFTFLENNKHPITDEGNLIAYKLVREDFKDIYTGTIDNSVGNVVEVPRNQVDDNPSQGCSNGLHVANYTYANEDYRSFATGRNVNNPIMLEIEVDPADVVSVPSDYNFSKMRVCKYIVIGTCVAPITKPIVNRGASCNDEQDDYNDDGHDHCCGDCCGDCENSDEYDEYRDCDY